MFKDVFRTSLPVAFGYVPLGMAFGVLLQNLGISWYWATAMGIFVFAGAAQFMAVTLLSQRVGLAEVFSATLLLNLRHVFYGLAILDRYKPLGFLKPYAVFGLTDETFSIISTSEDRPDDSRFILGVTALNHIWWVLGCTLGAMLRTSIQFDSTGLEFSLTCLFAVLLLEQWLKSKDPLPIVLGLFFGVASLTFFQGKNFLLIAIAGVLILTPFTRRISA